MAYNKFKIHTGLASVRWSTPDLLGRISGRRHVPLALFDAANEDKKS